MSKHIYGPTCAKLEVCAEEYAALLNDHKELLEALEQISGLSNAYVYDAPDIAKAAIQNVKSK